MTFTFARVSAGRGTMTLRRNRCLRLEQLEDRCVPAVSATISAGTLLVTGEATNRGDTIAIVQTSPGVFTVSDGATPVTINGSGAVTDVAVRLGHASDTVRIDLGGFTL